MDKSSGPLYEIIDLARGADTDAKQTEIQGRLLKILKGCNLRAAATVFASELVPEFPEASCAILGLRQITRDTILRLLRTLFPGAGTDYSFLTEAGGLKIDSVDEVMVPTHGQQFIRREREGQDQKGEAA